MVAGAPSLRCLFWSDNKAQPVNDLIRSINWSDLQGYPDASLPCASSEDDLATIIYTSGSTGQPKGVMCAHANMIAATNSVNGYLQNRANDIILNGLPLSFGYGLYQIFLAFQVGARVIIEKNFAFPARTIKLLEEEGVTASAGSTHLLRAFTAVSRSSSPRFSKAPLYHECCGRSAAAASRQIRNIFPRARFFSMYGQTECKRVCYLPPEELDRRPLSVGVPIPNTRVSVVNELGEPAPAGEIGELLVYGPHVMQGYWRAPELTAQRFRPGSTSAERVLHTGDLFKMDEDGFLYFVARKDDIIKCRGEKVSPLEIENVLCELEGVSQAAVVGVPDPLLGEAIKLILVRQESSMISERDVRSYCARKSRRFHDTQIC